MSTSKVVVRPLFSGCRPVFATLAWLLLSATLAQGQIIQNGSFEDGYTGWTATGRQGIATSDPNRPPTDGSRVDVLHPEDLSTNAALSQTFNTTPGQRYDLAFDFGAVGSISDQLLEVRLDGDGVLDDEVVTIAALDTNPFYVPQHVYFTANSVQTKLTFFDASYTYVFIAALLDNVRVTTVDPQAPVITAQPQRIGIAQGSDAVFSVTASGPGSLSYQWYFNDNPIGGATGASYTVSAANYTDAGNYSVVVTNGFGSIASSAATLTVVPPAILLNSSFEYRLGLLDV